MSAGPIGVRPVGEGAVEPAEIIGLAPGHQGFGQVRSHVELVVPAPPALREVAAAAGHRDVQDRQLAHRLRMGGGQRIGDGAAPVMAGQQE